MQPEEEDYFSAGLRHLRDSRSLAEQASDNAGYLAGYVIECSLKRVLALYGHAGRAFDHDIKNLQGRALALAALLAPGAARYRIDDIPGLEQACADWSPELRYQRSGTLGSERSQRLVEVAHALHEQILIPLMLDGVEDGPR